MKSTLKEKLVKRYLEAMLEYKTWHQMNAKSLECKIEKENN